ncbi:hypothetical protein DEU56DRAFT_375450 [Suillus clintonianus]|uniref:uncharacterized protein n=1 Tax=Suillus clintonianus TaxID=1904413 RepID=UPI001B864676|nr:uncharacterized protein DEU56DRAFT_375450 [Suillus clintonianus]KAG2154694.1 hypothetical protein DEU56DRAFT_375450 [Suillus clintonianus]
MAPDIQTLLGANPSADSMTVFLKDLAQHASASLTAPEVKSYSDAVYFNYYILGISFLFIPQKGYKPTGGLKREHLKDDSLVLDSINIYNAPKPKATPEKSTTSSRTAELAFSTYPMSKWNLSISPEASASNESSIEISLTTTGKDFVSCLGEPDRKGGGAGPSSGSIGIWCEWSKHGIMVEFGGDEARGPQAWERGKDAMWRVITVFPPKQE